MRGALVLALVWLCLGVDPVGRCMNKSCHCGAACVDCWCDYADRCARFGDCCPDHLDACPSPTFTPTPGPNQPGHIQWHYPAGPGSSETMIETVPPVFIDGLVVFMSQANQWTTFALDALTGEEKWRFVPPSWSACSTSVAAANHLVFLATQCNYPPGATAILWALSSSSGAVVWNITVASSSAMAGPVVDDGGMVFFPLSTLYAVDAANGKVKWLVQKASASNFPAVSAGILYLSAIDTNFYAYETETGNLLWSQPHCGGFWGGPTVANGLVFSPMLNNISAFDAVSGELRWYTPVAVSQALTVAVEDDRVFVAGRIADVVVALNVTTGTHLWSFRNMGSGFYNSIPFVLNGHVFVGSEAGLWVVQADSGQRVWNFTAPNAVRSPVVWNNFVYFGVVDHYSGFTEIFAIVGS